MRRIILIAALALSGCMAAPESANGALPPPAPPGRPADDPALSYGGLNEDIRVGDLVVTPLAVTEDSRCPVDVTCVWSGRLVLQVGISGMAGDQAISSIRPLPLPGGGELALESVWPPRHQNQDVIQPYRFGFRRR